MLYVFDMGNVVIKGIDVLTDTIKLLGVDAGEFLCDYKHYEFPLMDGSLTVDEYYRHLEHIFGIEIKTKPISDFFRPHFNEPIVKVLEELKKRGERIICASNTYEPHWNIIHKRGLDCYFDKSYLSHEMGLTKPSRAFFEQIMREEHVNPCEMIFTDDYYENIEAAQKLEIKTVWYKKDFDDKTLFDYYF